MTDAEHQFSIAFNKREHCGRTVEIAALLDVVNVLDVVGGASFTYCSSAPSLSPLRSLCVMHSLSPISLSLSRFLPHRTGSILYSQLESAGGRAISDRASSLLWIAASPAAGSLCIQIAAASASSWFAPVAKRSARLLIGLGIFSQRSGGSAITTRRFTSTLNQMKRATFARLTQAPNEQPA